MLPNGEVWAAFLSNRFGTSQDLWLGRSEKGKWIEFLFTGERHGGNQFGAHFYSDSNRTPRGKLVVDGDGVALGPPGGKRAEDPQKLEQEMDQIQQALGEAASRSASPEARRKEMQRLEARMLQIQVGLQQSLTLQSTGVLTGSWSFSLAALRKDDDRDGLTNVVEKRLGLDPKKPDTDGDGTLDGRDVNPLAKPTGASARTRILQGLFDLLLGGDPERRPRYVRLEKGLEQEFYGTRGRVLLLPPEEPLPPGSSGLVELHFAGPRSAEDTLLEREGPCLLNAQRDRAEVNFWLQIAGETSYTGGLMYGVSSGSEDENQSTTGHFVARFRKEAGDQWRAESIRPFRWRLPKPAN
ncbi:MAG: hypothetical protein FJX77_12975 [Armatimonadetes bacterium]|nr:hypothetical protein [Armatimonadota bacterium]